MLPTFPSPSSFGLITNNILDLGLGGGGGKADSSLKATARPRLLLWAGRDGLPAANINYVTDAKGTSGDSCLLNGGGPS